MVSTNSVQILIYKSSNFIDHHWGCASIYRPLSYPLRFLKQLIDIQLIEAVEKGRTAVEALDVYYPNYGVASLSNMINTAIKDCKKLWLIKRVWKQCLWHNFLNSSAATIEFCTSVLSID